MLIDVIQFWKRITSFTDARGFCSCFNKPQDEGFIASNLIDASIFGRYAGGL